MKNSYDAKNSECSISMAKLGKIIVDNRQSAYSILLDEKGIENNNFIFASFEKMTRVPQIPSRKGKSQNSRTGKHSARISKPRRKSREQEYYIDESRPATSRTGMSTARSNVSKRSNVQEYQLTGG